MRILVTGGFGYLGGRLSQFLSSKSIHQVTLGTRHSVTSPHWLPQAKVVQIEWDSPENLQDICSNFDAVVHTAGMNAQDCAADPSMAFEVNAVATGRLVEAAINVGIKRFIYYSTAHIYSSPLTGVLTEETSPVSVHPYARSHLAGEELVGAAHQRDKIEGVVMRLSNAFGVPAHKEANCWMLLANDLCRQAITTRKLVLHTSGLQRRDFVPVTDVCRASEHLLNLPGEELGMGVFNIGGSWTPTIWEMASLIQQRCKAVLGYETEIIRPSPGPDEASDALDYRIDRLTSTGFQPVADRVEEIDGLLKFCREEFV